LLNEEVNCTEPSHSAAVPGTDDSRKSAVVPIIKNRNKKFKRFNIFFGPKIWTKTKGKMKNKESPTLRTKMLQQGRLTEREGSVHLTSTLR
jgi:hypothetical protein